MLETVVRLAALSPDTKVDAGCSFHCNMCAATLRTTQTLNAAIGFPA